MSSRRTRQAAKGTSRTLDTDSIPLVQPDRTKSPSAQTLYELASQQQSGISSPGAKITTTQINTEGETLSADGLDNGSDDEHPLSYLLTVLLYTISLTLVNFTLTVFVHHQYRQEISWDLILTKTATAFPLLLTLVYVVHSRASNVWMQFVFLLGGAAAGAYVVHASTLYSYYAVMERVPPLGTLWIWTVAEMEVAYALGSVAVVGMFFVLGGYSIS